MSDSFKNQKQILQKLKIDELNEMQKEMQHYFHAKDEILLLSPTGSGKTLAFLLPLISSLKRDREGIQAIVIVPSRELAMQIEQVARETGSGFKINSVYGGRKIAKERAFLKPPPDVLIGTPGRMLDHFSRGDLDLSDVSVLILDEFDKSLEVGFQEEMEEIYGYLEGLKKKVLSSATNGVEIPEFIEFENPQIVDFLHLDKPDLKLLYANSPSKDKLQALEKTLFALKGKRGVVFCNYRESTERISEFLEEHNIDHGVYHGGLDQIDRDRALVMFRNSSHLILIATDLAARGLDIPELDYIIHYHLPSREEDFVHRNGRTARMKKSGMAILIKWKNEAFPEYLKTKIDRFDVDDTQSEMSTTPQWQTIRISAGRRDKISKGDIAGFLFKKGGLKHAELGLIELKQECAFAAVDIKKVKQLIKLVDQEKIKKRKVRVEEI